MRKIGKLIGWLFILGIAGYIGFNVMQGQSGSGGRAIYVNSLGEEATVLKFPPCMDTDGGKIYIVRGSTYNTQENDISEDYCEDENNLMEFFCNNEYPDNIIIECNCFKGVCV